MAIVIIIMIELLVTAVDCHSYFAEFYACMCLVYGIMQEYYTLTCTDLVYHISEHVQSIRRLNTAAELSQ